MATIDTLTIEIGASSEGATREIDKVSSALQRIKGSTTKIKVDSKDVDKASKKTQALGNILSSLKRIAFYRVIRSAIKAVTQAFSEGLKNAYAFASGIESAGHRFAVALDSMKTGGSIMKNQLGSAFLALLAAIAPIVNAIIGLITRLAIALSQLFGAFTGGTWLRATNNANDLADACGGGAAAAKEWKNQLLGFDEINKLEAPDDGGGGGGGGLSDLSSMFEDAELEGIFAKLHEKIEELKASLDFEPLKKALEDLRGAFSRLGDTILKGLSWAWYNILVPLAHWTIESFAPVAIETLASAIDFLNAVLQVLAPLFEDFWNNVLVPLAEWDAERIIDGLEGLNKLFEKLTDLINGDISFEDFISGMGGVEGAIQRVCDLLNPFNALAKALGYFFGDEFVALLESAGLNIDSLWGSITTFGDNVKQTWEDIKTGFDELVKWFETKWDALKKWWEGLDLGSFHIPLPHITVSGSFSLMPPSAPSFSIDWYAGGGFPEDGLFMANHSELVGKFANGKTAVANNEQIIAGIERGVYNAMSSVMGGQSESGTKVAVLEVNGREFARAIFDDQTQVANYHGISLINA